MTRYDSQQQNVYQCSNLDQNHNKFQGLFRGGCFKVPVRRHLFLHRRRLFLRRTHIFPKRRRVFIRRLEVILLHAKVHGRCLYFYGSCSYFHGRMGRCAYFYGNVTRFYRETRFLQRSYVFLRRRGTCRDPYEGHRNFLF